MSTTKASEKKAGGTRPAAERLQPKLTVGDVNDPLEREADEVARQVVSGQPAPGVARMAAGPEKKQEPVRRKAGSEQKRDEAMSNVAQRAVDTKGPGRPLDAPVRSHIESSTGADLSHVRVHDDAGARAAAASINARAFTHGSDIWMGPGESASDTGLMAHEAAHVIQQSGNTAQRLVQRNAEAAPTAAVTPEEAEADLLTFNLPPIKERHRPVYEGWAGRGMLTRAMGYDRGEPDQRESVWLPGVTIDPQKLEALDLPPTFSGRKTIKIHNREIEGTAAQLQERLKVPNWDRTGRFHPFSFEVDHIIELQVGSWEGGATGAANEIQNMELLDKSSNASAGSLTRNAIRNNVRRYLEAIGQPAGRDDVTEYLAEHPVRFTRVVVGTEGAGASQWWTKAEIEAGEHLKEAQPVANVGEAGTATSFALTSPSGAHVLGQFAHAEGAAGIAIESEVDKRRVAGLIITNFSFAADRTAAVRDAPVGTAAGTFDLPPTLQATGTPLSIPLHSAGQYAAYLGALPPLGSAHFAPMSLIEFDTPTIEAGELHANGRLTPSIPLLGSSPIQVALRGRQLAFAYFYSAGELALPIPGISIDDATLGVMIGTEGFRAEGGIYFTVQRLGNGSLTAAVDGAGSFEAAGSFDFDSELFDEARAEIWYRGRAFGGRGTLRISRPDKVRGIRSLQAEVTLGENQITATGTVSPDIPGVESATLRIEYSEAEGLLIGGTATLSNRVPGISSGSMEVEVRRAPDGTSWMLAAHGTAVPAIPGLDTTLTVDYDNGALTIAGTAAYERGMLSGAVELGATNRVLDPAGRPTDDIGPQLRVYGGGALTVQLTPWLQGTVGVRFLPNGEIELMGEIALPNTLDIFPEKRLDRNIFAINLDIPIVGFAVAGQRVGIFATIGGGLDLSAGVGPGQLRDLGVGITYNPDHEDQTHVTGGARLVIPAQAGLRLFIRGALGAGIPIVSASMGLEVGAELGLEGAAEASVQIDWTPATGLVLDAMGEIYVQPKFRFDLTGFLLVEADLVLTTIELYEKRWQLAAFEAGPDLRFGVRFPIHYEEGQPFDISMDDLEFDVPDVDPLALMDDVVDQIIGE